MPGLEFCNCFFWFFGRWVWFGFFSRLFVGGAFRWLLIHTASRYSFKKERKEKRGGKKKKKERNECYFSITVGRSVGRLSIVTKRMKNDYRQQSRLVSPAQPFWLSTLQTASGRRAFELRRDCRH